MGSDSDIINHFYWLWFEGKGSCQWDHSCSCLEDGELGHLDWVICSLVTSWQWMTFRKIDTLPCKCNYFHITFSWTAGWQPHIATTFANVSEVVLAKSKSSYE